MQQLFQDGAVVLFLDAFLKKASVGVVSMAIPFPASPHQCLAKSDSLNIILPYAGSAI